MRLPLPALGLILGLGAGCVYTKADGQRLETEVYALQTRTQSIESQLEALQAEQAKQREQLAQLLADVGDLNTAARRNDADFGVQLDDLLRQIAQMQGSLQTLDSRTAELEAGKVAAKEQQEQQKAKAEAEAAEAAERAKLLSSPSEALAEVKKLLDRGAPADARRLLKEVMRQNRDNRAFRGYAARAQYLMGETYFAEGEYQAAAKEYNLVRKNHPKAGEVSDALLKVGMCFERLGLKDDAKLFFQTVVKSYGKTPAGKEARRRLKKL